jgi:ferrous iron transport protein B
MKRIALLGMPNTGKSTLFNRLTGASARVGNWPGITVDLMAAKVVLGGNMVEIVDLPGIYDLHGFSDDEKVVRHFLEESAVDLVVVLANATQVSRQLPLLLQLRHLGYPAVLLLNMADEAHNMGVRIDAEKMSAMLNLPVLLISAKYGRGMKESIAAITETLRVSTPAAPDKARASFSPEDEIEATLEKVLAHSVSVPTQLNNARTDRLDRYVLHPVLGLPLFFGVMFLLFEAVFWLGAPLQKLMQGGFDLLRESAIEPLLAGAPPALSGFLLEGVYAGLATVAAFVPIIVLFFVMMAVVEDTGYLSRAAFLTDAFMSRLGLDGRSFVMLLMGFGCNVPAVMGTRVMRSRALRLLSMLVIPFSLCSARLQVFLFLIAALFTANQAPVVLFSLYLFSFAAAIITALAFRGQFAATEPLVLELPPYRLPTARQVLVRGGLEVMHFLRRASKIIVAGVIVVWLLTHFPWGANAAGSETYADTIGRWLHPVFAPLGISDQLTIALLFGFVAKEVVIGSLAVIYSLEGEALTAHLAHQLTWLQAYSFMLFTLIYTPCLSTIAALRAESRSLSFAALAIAWPLALAWLVTAAFYQTALFLSRL